VHVVVPDTSIISVEAVSTAIIQYSGIRTLNYSNGQVNNDVKSFQKDMEIDKKNDHDSSQDAGPAKSKRDRTKYMPLQDNDDE